LLAYRRTRCTEAVPPNRPLVRTSGTQCTVVPQPLAREFGDLLLPDAELDQLAAKTAYARAGLGAAVDGQVARTVHLALRGFWPKGIMGRQC
jgi:hypothetical protein